MNTGVIVKKWPTTLILPGADLIDRFQSETAGAISVRDQQEIVDQIFATLMTEIMSNLEVLRVLPNYSRMTGTSFLSDVTTTTKVKDATFALSVAIYKRLKEIGAYEGQTCSYFFWKFLGKDIVLSHIPY